MGASSSSSGGTCPLCATGLKCCGTTCVDEQNDIDNCGGCGTKCTGTHPYCHLGVCGTPVCSDPLCPLSQACCGPQCCPTGQICCDPPPGILGNPKCVSSLTGICPP